MSTTTYPPTHRLQPAASASRRHRRQWPLALVLTGALLALMLLLAMLQSGSCVPGRCIEIPPWVLYTLHATAIVCCLWGVVDSLFELLEARRGIARAVGTHR